MHGGISDRITSLQQLNELRRPLLTLPSPSLEMDLLWADPMLDIRGVEPSPRGAGVVFGEDVVFRICELLNLNYIIRAHEVGRVDRFIFFKSFPFFSLCWRA